MTVHCGISLGHDAGLCICDDSGLTLIELERLIKVKHACGGEVEARRALGEAFEEFGESVSHLAFSDYFTSRTKLMPDEVLRCIADSDHRKWYAGFRSIGKTAFLDQSPRESGVARHHFAHAASAYYSSSFDAALILCLDGIGSDDDCGLIAVGTGNSMAPELSFKAFHGPRFGLLYEAATRSIFGSQFDTGKLMGLAAYGTVRDEWVDVFRILLAGNSFRKEYPQLLDVVDLHGLPQNVSLNGITYTYGNSFGDYFGASIEQGRISVLDAYAYSIPSSIGEGLLDPAITGLQSRDIAATIQYVFETELLRLVSGLRRIYPQRFLCYAGGCALNINANSLILENAGYDDIHIPSCCNDSGIAAGAALASYHATSRSDARPGLASIAFAGLTVRGGLPSMDALWSAGIALRQYESLNPLLDDVAARLATGKMIAWVCGRMETGPRALGRRSILASPLITGMRRRVSEEIKGREWFRPIAPISPASQAEQWFDGPVHKCESMLFAVRCKSELPEITHADGTARLQTVHLDTNPELLRLLSKFAAMTDVPILMNTSLNPRGKPIINQVSDAVTFLAGSELDALVLVDRLAVMDKASLDR